MKSLLLILILFSTVSYAEESVCYGSPSNGSLQKGTRLPAKGNNFIGYSLIGRIMGRTYVHSAVKNIVINAYQQLEQEQATTVYKYAETGFKKGGEFSPHKTHQNGLSVDFMTPVIDSRGVSVHLPTHPFNKLGYNIEFDQAGVYKKLRIDYIALAAHLVALHQHAKNAGYDLSRVIFDPELQAPLFKTPFAEYLQDNIQFSKKRSWVRHDEHYHVDFLIPCDEKD